MQILSIILNSEQIKMLTSKELCWKKSKNAFLNAFCLLERFPRNQKGKYEPVILYELWRSLLIFLRLFLTIQSKLASNSVLSPWSSHIHVSILSLSLNSLGYRHTSSFLAWSGLNLISDILKRFILLLNYVYMFVSVCMDVTFEYMCQQRPEEDVRSPGVKTAGSCGHPKWLLGAKLRSSSRPTNI